MSNKKKLAVIQHDPDLAELSKIVLAEAGYDAEVFDFDEDPITKIGQFKADTLVMDLLPHEDHCWSLLERLSKDPDTIRLPVVILATAHPCVEDALTHPNVKQTILVPFNIDELIDKVKAAVEGMPLLPWVRPEVVPEMVLEEAARILADNSRDIVFRWLRRVGATEPFRSRPDLHLPQLLDQIPLLITTAISVLRFGFTKEAVEQMEDLWKTAPQHALERRAQGIPLKAVIIEYQYLRDELWRALSTGLPLERLTPKDIFVLGERLHYSLDQLLVVTTEAYTEG